MFKMETISLDAHPDLILESVTLERTAASKICRCSSFHVHLAFTHHVFHETPIHGNLVDWDLVTAVPSSA